MLPLRYLNPFLLTWLEAHEHRQDPGENGRRVENFFVENEHLSQIIGGRPVYLFSQSKRMDEVDAGRDRATASVRHDEDKPLPPIFRWGVGGRVYSKQA